MAYWINIGSRGRAVITAGLKTSTRNTRMHTYNCRLFYLPNCFLTFQVLIDYIILAVGIQKSMTSGSFVIEESFKFNLYHKVKCYSVAKSEVKKNLTAHLYASFHLESALGEISLPIV